MNEKHNYKLTDEQFTELLWQCDGFLGLMPKAIYAKYGFTYSRQSVYERAEKFKDELRQIRETLLDRIESKLFKSLLADDTDIKLSSRVSLQLLDRLGKNRGWGKDGVDKIITNRREQVYKIGGKIIHF